MGLKDIQVRSSAYIHPKAHVEDSVIGENTKIWQFASVIRGARLGHDCIVGAGAVIDGSWFGDRCLLGSGVVISPGFLIGDDVFIGPNAVMCNDMWPSTEKIDFHPELLFSDFVCIQVKDGASIGANATILPGVTIGKRALVAAGATVEKSIPDNCLYRRSGEIVPIKDYWRKNRMRSC